MPTTNDHRHIPPAAAAAIERFVDCAWRSQGSLFTPGQDVWTAANLDDLHRRFVQQPDESKATFLEKFRKQLVGAPALTWQLAAELLYVHSLTPFKMRAQVKVELVDAIRLASPSAPPTGPSSRSRS